MRTLCYEDWLDKYGSDYAIMLYEWLEQRPLNISLINDLGIYDLNDFINEKVLEAYEDYVSDVEDEEYDRYKDEKCF